MTGLIISAFASLFLIVPSLPEGKIKHFAKSITLVVQQIEISYYKFLSLYSFESNPRIFYFGETTPTWVENTISNEELTDEDQDIVAHLLTQKSWKWSLTDCTLFRIERGVDLPELELHDVWSRDTFVFGFQTPDEQSTAYYPMNDLTRKQLSDNKSQAVSHVYHIIGGSTLLLGFLFQGVSSVL